MAGDMTLYSRGIDNQIMVKTKCQYKIYVIKL